ncbi:MAG TPA: hypothetical protein PLD84_10890, partial [Chitinophagales bacterium]|nr:hypothetical protein [Chitinophagales bacterium]
MYPSLPLNHFIFEANLYFFTSVKNNATQQLKEDKIFRNKIENTPFRISENLSYEIIAFLLEAVLKCSKNLIIALQPF